MSHREVWPRRDDDWRQITQAEGEEVPPDDDFDVEPTG